MQIWILSSSVDILILFRFLTKQDFVYTFFFDQEWGDRSEKNSNFVFQRVEKLLEMSKRRWIEAVILPPLIELHFLQQEKWHDYIIPLFRTYLIEECLPFSRTWKLGFVGDYFDSEHQGVLKEVCDKHELTAVQQTIKKFHKPFVFRFKHARMWKYFIMQLGWKNWMMHNVLKRDLRGLVDAWVDTIIPCNYWYFAYDVTIQKLIRSKKMYRHWLGKVEKVFNHLYATYNQKAEQNQKYKITIVYTWHVDLLLNEKKLVRLVGKGKKSEINTEKISL